MIMFPEEPTKPVKLQILGISVPAFKNRKRAIRDHKTGKMRTLTDPVIKRKMDLIVDQIINAIACELLYDIGINESGTVTVQQVRSWIASRLPLRDSRQWIPSLYIDAVDCAKGEEGAEIIIENL